MVKNLSYNAGDAASIPGQGTKIPHALGQLSLRAKTTEPARLNEDPARAATEDLTQPTINKINK